MFQCKTILYTFFLLMCFADMPALAQVGPEKVTRAFDHYRNKALQEKLYVHTDRVVYITGDYLWFKVYCVEGAEHKPLAMSKVAYVEILDQNQSPVLQTRVGLKEGVGHTALFIPSTLNSGNYTFRAYTRWMMNFDPEFYFTKTITIINPFKKPEPVATEKTKVPQYDIQFFPEGGDLVAGLKSKVAFRMVDSNGRGIALEGRILNEQNDTLASFTPLKFGLGHFSFTPQSNNSYRAVIRDLNGDFATWPLPVVHEQGYVIMLTDGNSDVDVTVSSTELQGKIQLLSHTRNKVALDTILLLNEGKAFFKVRKELLNEGISHITVFSDKQVPVCERLFFKSLKHNLVLTEETNKRKYTTRKSVLLSIGANDSDANPVEADLSVSVYRLDSLQHEDPMDIKNYMLLTSELPGTIESPAYYFGNDPVVAEALDNLMLTHGWRRFSWMDIINESLTYPYFPEYHGSVITGKVQNIETGEPAANVPVYLSIPGKQFHLRGSRSSRSGEIKFELTDLYGPLKIILQTNTSVDSIYRISIANSFSTQYSKMKPDRFMISRGSKDELLTRSINMQLENTYHENTRSMKVLPETDSIPFYGKPDERYFLDDYTRFPVMEDVMREYVPGVFARKRKGNFFFLVSNKNDNTILDDNPLVLLDGVPIFNINKIMEYNPLKVKRLDVVTHRYYYGPFKFQGIVSYTTYHGDLRDFQLDSRALVKNYEGIQWQRQFFSPVYETSEQLLSRTPDFRDLLFWSPSVKTNGEGKASLSFYTSDQPGTYLVNVQGQTSDGLQGSNTFTISVHATENN